MVKLGCHVSIAKSVDLAFDRAKKKTCDVFQIFVKNPRGWGAKVLSEEEVRNFRSNLKTKSMNPIFAHISYLPNLASQNPELYNKSIECFISEIERSKILGIPFFVVHGGSFKGGTIKQGIVTYVKSLLKGIEASESKLTILIENSSGGQNSLTGLFTTIKKIMSEIEDSKSLKLCFDTCHGFSSGYDLREIKGIERTKEELHENIGLSNLALIHANDSLGELKSFRDRHEHIGLGKIGEKGFKAMINDEDFSKVPWILETPIDERRNDVDNLKYLRNLINEKRI